ncbi:hypothetical protein SLEP1_g1778 [Rubroshorea leprosula]|uniref:chorismate mutase n=1 Tax=Rubroshorea leprosula TaxID=152421 RepID=A0AAV5HJE6_9ROSI|nr:hypothetical protein SLEP1_g1778 [Rubroshorea leprosula]
MVEAEPSNLGVGSSTGITLDSVRDALIRQEDTIIFSLIERAKFPLNSPAYNQSSLSIPGFSGSLVQFFVKETENLQAKILYPAAASINLNKAIWDMYFNQLLPLFVAPGDDGNYASTAASDLQCLQVFFYFMTPLGAE